MYLSFFGLKEYPFNLTPDPRFLFMSRSHREAFDHLLFGIHQRRGFMEVVGGIGTGKTTLCRALLEDLDGRVPTALIFNTFLSEIELLRTINDEFRIDSSGVTRKSLIDALNRFLIDQLARGENACLILDECQHLAVPVLEQIRMLSNLETESEKLLQIVMVGQPEFHDLLKSPPLQALDERIHVRSFLEPLTQEDTRGYIQHRLTFAGSRGDIVFTDGALRVIYEYSRGIPRRINTVCDRCLLIAYTRGTFRVNRGHARQAIREIRGGSPARKGIRWRWRERIAASTPLPGYVSLVALGLLGGWILWSVLAPKPELQVVERLVPMSAPAEETLSAKELHSQKENVATKEVQTQEATIAAKEQQAEVDLPAFATASLPVPTFRRLPGLAGLVLPSDGAGLKEVARREGFEARQASVSWDGLIRFQRSCVLEIAPEEGMLPTLRVLRGISEAGVWIQEGDVALRFLSRSELMRLWSGTVWVLVPSENVRNDLKPGATGQTVVRLQESLARLGYWEGAPTGIYDEPTRRGVMAFQTDLHLKVDGRAGAQTQGMILQFLGEEQGAP